MDLTHWLGVIFRSVLALGVLGTRALAGEVLENTCALVPFHAGGKLVSVFLILMFVCSVLVERVTAISFACLSLCFCIS